MPTKESNPERYRRLARECVIGRYYLQKTFRISPTFEFMIGVGPSISRTLNDEDQSTTVSAAFTLDFMFWPTPNVGWFLEPTWTVTPETVSNHSPQALVCSSGFRSGRLPQLRASFAKISQ